MPEYIEREALIVDIAETVVFTVKGGASLPTSEMRGANKVVDRIKSAPTADVVEVRHSEWKQVVFDDGAKSCKCCMACGTFVEPQYNYKYCPNCGAKMDGKGGCDE